MKNRSYMQALVDKRVAIGLFIWWLINLLQAAFTELAHDEAYYFMFSQQLDWGYFDHPPMTALLIWLGSFMGGEFGVRFFFTILQPLYLWILWCIIRPRDPHRSDATIFLIASAALPILQLYGFIAVPDVPFYRGRIDPEHAVARFYDGAYGIQQISRRTGRTLYPAYQSAYLYPFTHLFERGFRTHAHRPALMVAVLT